MAQLTPEELAAGVITSSAGNHAQGVALSARALGCSAVICMPVTTPAIKVAAVRALGATAELVGENYNETQAHALVGPRGGGVHAWGGQGEENSSMAGAGIPPTNRGPESSPQCPLLLHAHRAAGACRAGGPGVHPPL